MSNNILSTLHQIQSLPLNNSQYGKTLNDRLQNIDENFETIIDSDYLRGPKGNSIITKRISLGEKLPENLKIGEASTYRDLIESAILKGVNVQNSDSLRNKSDISWDDNLKNAYIIMQYEEIVDELGLPREVAISCHPYVFIDARFQDLSSESSIFKDMINLSCTIYFDAKKLELETRENPFLKDGNFPTIVYRSKINPIDGTDQSGFYWRINSIDTNLKAEGPKGKDGLTGKSYVVRYDSEGYVTGYVDIVVSEIPEDKLSGAWSQDLEKLWENIQTNDMVIGFPEEYETIDLDNPQNSVNYVISPVIRGDARLSMEQPKDRYPIKLAYIDKENTIQNISMMHTFLIALRSIGSNSTGENDYGPEGLFVPCHINEEDPGLIVAPIKRKTYTGDPEFTHMALDGHVLRKLQNSPDTKDRLQIDDDRTYSLDIKYPDIKLGKKCGLTYNENNDIGTTTIKEAVIDDLKIKDFEGDDYKYINELPLTYKTTDYKNLVNLINTNSLVPGAFYRLTDYVTNSTFVQPLEEIYYPAISDGNQYDIILLATDTDQISNSGYAVRHRDTNEKSRGTTNYFSNSDLGAWQIWYSPTHKHHQKYLDVINTLKDNLISNERFYYSTAALFPAKKWEVDLTGSISTTDNVCDINTILRPTTNIIPSLTKYCEQLNWVLDSSLSPNKSINTSINSTAFANLEYIKVGKIQPPAAQIPIFGFNCGLAGNLKPQYPVLNRISLDVKDSKNPTYLFTDYLSLKSIKFTSYENQYNGFFRRNMFKNCPSLKHIFVDMRNSTQYNSLCNLFTFNSDSNQLSEGTKINLFGELSTENNQKHIYIHLLTKYSYSRAMDMNLKGDVKKWTISSPDNLTSVTYEMMTKIEIEEQGPYLDPSVRENAKDGRTIIPYFKWCSDDVEHQERGYWANDNISHLKITYQKPDSDPIVMYLHILYYSIDDENQSTSSNGYTTQEVIQLWENSWDCVDNSKVGSFESFNHQDDEMTWPINCPREYKDDIVNSLTKNDLKYTLIGFVTPADKIDKNKISLTNDSSIIDLGEFYSKYSGTIYRMIDEYNNDCPYDFKNIKLPSISVNVSTSSMKFNHSYTFEMKDTPGVDASVNPDNKIANNKIIASAEIDRLYIPVVTFKIAKDRLCDNNVIYNNNFVNITDSDNGIRDMKILNKTGDTLNSDSNIYIRQLDIKAGNTSIPQTIFGGQLFADEIYQVG